MSHAVAINVGANTTLPGFRGPIYPDGRFVYVPIPEREPTAEPVPTYADLDLPIEIPDAHLDTPVHLDPSFEEYPCCEQYTYGDEHGVKARPLSELTEGDYVLFYATLETAADPPESDGEQVADDDGVRSADEIGTDDGPAETADGYGVDRDRTGDPVDWIPPEWGAYLIGGFRLDREPVTDYDTLSPVEQGRFATNAHVRRTEIDAEVLLSGDPGASGLYDRAVPLSRPDTGGAANRIVTDLSADSGKGPWWRRPLRFDEEATETLLDVIETGAVELFLR